MSFLELCSSLYSYVNAKSIGVAKGPYYSIISETKPSKYLPWVFFLDVYFSSKILFAQ